MDPENAKAYFIISMADDWTQPHVSTQMTEIRGSLYPRWTPGEPMPSGLVETILSRLHLVTQGSAGNTEPGRIRERRGPSELWRQAARSSRVSINTSSDEISSPSVRTTSRLIGSIAPPTINMSQDSSELSMPVHSCSDSLSYACSEHELHI